MKHKIFAFVLVMLMSVLGASSVLAAEMTFTDISGHWAEEAIGSVVEKGLFKGTSETTFSPDVSMDRGMFVTVLGRFAEKMGVEVKGDSAFEDVSRDAYYAPYVAWAADHGIVKGTSQTTFSPLQPVTREQMCALFIRLLDFAKYQIPEGSGTSFVDYDSISDYAKDVVQSAVALGLIKGIETADGMAFCPADSATRAQVATVFLRLDGLEGIYEALKPVDPTPTPTPTPSPTPTPTPSPTPTPTPSPTPMPTPTPTPTEEEAVLEAEVAGYMATMLQNYDKSEYVLGTDKEVQNCMKLIADCVRDALRARENETFLSKEYVDWAYSVKINQAKEMYKAMTEDQQNQMANVAVRLETVPHLRAILDYFGFSGLI